MREKLRVPVEQDGHNLYQNTKKYSSSSSSSNNNNNYNYNNNNNEPQNMILVVCAWNVRKELVVKMHDIRAEVVELKAAEVVIVILW